MNKSVSDIRAIFLALGSFAVWVLVDTCMKLSSETNLPPHETVAVMAMFGVLLMLGFYGPRGQIKNLWPNNPRNQIIRGLLSLTSMFLNAVAFKYLPLTLFYVTVFSAPMMIAILAAVFLKEHLTLSKTIAVVAGFFGVIVAVNPFQDFANGEWIGYLSAFGSTTAFAISTTWMRRISQNETTACTTFFTALIESIGCGIALLWHCEPLTPYLWVVLFFAGLLCALGNFAFFAALKHTKALNVAQFHYTQIVIGALLGYLIWNDVPKLNVYIGATIIIGSGLYIAQQAAKGSLRENTHPL